MTTPDVSRLSYAELIQLSRDLEQQIQAKRTEELKVVVDGFAKKLEASGFTVAEGIEALQPYVTSASKGKKAASGAPVRVMYRDPANAANTWSGRGRAAKWLADYEAQGRNREEFRVKD